MAFLGFKNSPLLLLYLALLFVSCRNNSRENKLSTIERNIEFQDAYLRDVLYQVSIDYIESKTVKNNVIEVIVDKKDPEAIYLILTCRGLYYFEAQQLNPLLTYEIRNNTFFVFTGVEDLISISFDYKKLGMRIKENCDTMRKSCYWVRDGKWEKDKECIFPLPFSSTGPEVSPPSKR